MEFRKYEFTDWATEKAKIWNEETGYNNCHVVEIGFLPITPAVLDEEGNVITPAVLSDKFAVDILWNETASEEFTSSEVWPSPVGIHTFAGLEYLYENAYYDKTGTPRPEPDLGI